MTKCPDCQFAKCRWIELKSKPEKLASEELKRVLDHNIAYIEMVFGGHQGSALAEERMHNRLSPYAEELERRKVVESHD